MKVLVTGTNSYAGTQFAKRITELNKEWNIEFVSVRDNAWEDKDFSPYDSVYHVAGIVHKKETSRNKDLYSKVNRDLTYQLALKSKNDGVKSFVFLSTMAVYGLIGKIGKDTVISKETPAKPTSYYGKSKLDAEVLLNTLQSQKFNVSILRIPMIYGYGCPGNYSALSKLAKKTPIFPKINNKRSLIYIDHLSDLVIHLIENKVAGLFLVKNPEDVNTLDMVNEIAQFNNKKIYKSMFLKFLIQLFGNRSSLAKKMFGNMVFKLEDCKVEGFKYEALSFKESIALAEGREMNEKR